MTNLKEGVIITHWPAEKPDAPVTAFCAAPCYSAPEQNASFGCIGRHYCSAFAKSTLIVFLRHKYLLGLTLFSLPTNKQFPLNMDV